MKCSPAVGPGKPVLHELGVMIARVVKENMDERQHRIEGLDRFQKPDRRDGVDGLDLDHPGSTRFQVDCAVNIDALTSARLLDRGFPARAPSSRQAAPMGRMHGVREQHGFVVAQGIQEAIIACDEGLLLRFVELARMTFGL